MDREDVKKAWQHFLVEIGKSETEVAREIGQTQVVLNRKFKNGSVKFVEFENILNHYGYTLEIKRKE